MNPLQSLRLNFVITKRVYIQIDISRRFGKFMGKKKLFKKIKIKKVFCQKKSVFIESRKHELCKHFNVGWQ